MSDLPLPDARERRAPAASTRPSPDAGGDTAEGAAAMRQAAARREARIAGLHSFDTPTLEAVEQRRLQLWILTLLLLLAAAVGMVLLTYWRVLPSAAWITPPLAQLAVLGLVGLFCAYALEKELHLRRLTRLLVEERVLTAALTNRLREVNALLEAGKAINLDLDLDEVLATIVRCALELLGGNDCSILLVHGEGELCTVAASDRSAARGARVRIGSGVAGRVAATREPLLIDGALDHADNPHHLDVPPPQSAMSVPLVHRESLFGVLNVNAGEGRAYTPHDLRALSVFGEQAASAIANAQLYEAQRLSATQSSYRALRDPLTNLPNRALFLDRMNRALSRRRRDGQAAAVLFVDCDDFKRINDGLGHLVGDQVLIAFGERLRGSVRNEDTVARFGGDEFGVLLEVSSVAEAVAAAERLLASLSIPFSVGDREVHLTASVGVAAEGTAGSTPEDLLRSADVARYVAKGRGKGSFAFFDESMRADALGRLDLETELARALTRGELAVHFQPIFSLASRDVVAAEALLRWNHPTRGLLAAGSFLPFAQRAGILPTIDLWVLGEACRIARPLAERGNLRDRGNGFSMHANLLPTRLQDAGIVEKVASVLDEAGLAGDRLVLEITESAVLFDTDSAASRLNGLRALGVRLALDDFGTGYSSLSHLRRFPVHTVKIDRMFVDGIAKDSRERALVQGLVRFGLGLGLEVIAEGIERESQLDGLVQLGCHFGQGFYLAPPLPPEQFLEFVGRR